MNEIELCANSACSKRGSCFRYSAPADDKALKIFKQDAAGRCGAYIYEPGSDEEERDVQA